MPMASAPAKAAASPPSATVWRSPMVAVTPARKPIVEMTPSLRPKMTSRMSRPWGVCQASLWNRLSGSASLVTGAVNTSYLLETTRGKHLLRIDEVKSELEVKRELDLLLFLRKHGFPCPQPVADRKGRHYREVNGKCLTLYRYVDGHTVSPARLTAAKIENVGAGTADL